MDCSRGGQRIVSSINGQRVYLLDYKRGDVTGDGIPDNIYLYGNKPEGARGRFADNITLVIQDGCVNRSKAVTPQNNAGYDAKIYLGDFNSDGICDIKVTMETGDSSGSIICYIYSYKKRFLTELFNFEHWCAHLSFCVDYLDYYRVAIGNVKYNSFFTLDLSNSGFETLSQIYSASGKLIKPTQGDVLALSSVKPIMNDEKNDQFDLLTYHRIIGTSNADTLGYIENLLVWDAGSYALNNMTVSLLGTPRLSNF